MFFLLGIPNSFSELSTQQQERLAFAGGEAVVFLLGKVSDLHKVVPSREAQDRIFEKIKVLEAAVQISGPVRFRTLQTDNRHSRALALTEIKDFFAENPAESKSGASLRSTARLSAPP